MDDAPRSTRREFLEGKAAADALAHVLEPGETILPDANHYLVQFARQAMACQFEVFLNAGQYPQGTEAALAALDLVDRLEDQLSVFRPHSEVSRLNTRGAECWVEVEPRLFELLQRAIEIYRETAGAYDVTSAPLSKAWGFMRRAGMIPEADVLAAARASVGSHLLEFDRAISAVRFRQPGVEINLGSIGKGYALDRAGELLEALEVGDYLLHGGNSSVLARGAHAALGADVGWSIGVRDPLHPARRLGQLRVRDRALATSGSGTQFFIDRGKRYGHLLDPRSGWPAEGVLSVTVLAPTASEADALSTAFYVMGPEQTAEYCQRHPEIGAMMFCPGRRAGAIERHLLGIDERDWTDCESSSE